MGGSDPSFRGQILAVHADLPLVTDLMLATALVNALRNCAHRAPAVRAWDEYLGRQPRGLS